MLCVFDLSGQSEYSVASSESSEVKCENEETGRRKPGGNSLFRIGQTMELADAGKRPRSRRNKKISPKRLSG